MNKKFWSKKKWYLLLAIPIVGLISLPFILIGINSTQNKNNFIMGNYDDYISPAVSKYFNQKYNLNINTYLSSEEVVQNFKKNNMDCAIVPTYEAINLQKQGLIDPIDWSQLKIQGINNINDANQLFTPLVQNILSPDANLEKVNLLNWSIPYFVQDLIFIYRGEEINELKHANSWSQIMQIIANEKKFNNKYNNAKLPLFGIIDDQRTIYSLSLISQNITNITPSKNTTIEELEKGYTYFQHHFNNYQNSGLLFSDSNTLLNKVASGELRAAILYNGDAMYASWGGDIYSNDENYVLNPNDFHIVKPPKTLISLDIIVLNKKADPKIKQIFYQMIKQLCFSFDQNNMNDIEKNTTFINFEYVNYTPTLNSLYEYLINPTNDYFMCDIQNQILQIRPVEINASNIENPIDALTRSNFSFAYIWLKANIGK